MNRLIIMLLVQILCIGVLHAENTNYNTFLPAGFKQLSLDNLSVDDYIRLDPVGGKGQYHGDRETLENGFYAFTLKGDFNKNGKNDIVVSCNKNGDTTKSYVVILEENANSFQVISVFKFNNPRVMIRNRIYYNGLILLSFQAYTSHGESIKWNGRKYVIMEKSSTGP